MASYVIENNGDSYSEFQIDRADDSDLGVEADFNITTNSWNTGEELRSSNNVVRPVTPKSKDDPEPFVRQGTFRFMDLPAELRVYIYSFLLPHNVVLSHKQDGQECIRGRVGVQTRWAVDALDKTTRELVPFVVGRMTRPAHLCRGRFERHRWPHAQVQLFRVNKEISNEARAVLYGGNTYEFTINGSAHFPKSLASPLIFGPFANYDGSLLGLLRNLRSIHVDFLLDTDSHWAVTRQRSRLEYFVDVFKQHSDDEDRKSLLQELYIDVRIPHNPSRRHYTKAGYEVPIPEDCEQFMFGLESLATLRGIKDVKVTGVPEWYAQCLTLAIQGKGGDVLQTDWPLVEVKRTKNSNKSWTKKTKTKTAWVTTRKWWQPTLNWKEFAVRNKVDIPDDIEKFWGGDVSLAGTSTRPRRTFTPDPVGINW